MMKKVKTKYVEYIDISGEEETIDIEVNEEFNEQIRVEFFQKRRRTKAEFVELFYKISKTISEFK